MTLGAPNLILNESQISRLDSASAIALGVPHEQINASAKSLVAGQNLKPLLNND